MTAYRIKYQTRRKGGVAIWKGDWQDKEMIAVAGEDAREIIDGLVDTLRGHDFRLRGIEVIVRVDIMARNGFWLFVDD